MCCSRIQPCRTVENRDLGHRPVRRFANCAKFQTVALQGKRALMRQARIDLAYPQGLDQPIGLNGNGMPCRTVCELIVPAKINRRRLGAAYTIPKHIGIGAQVDLPDRSGPRHKDGKIWAAKRLFLWKVREYPARIMWHGRCKMIGSASYCHLPLESTDRASAKAARPVAAAAPADATYSDSSPRSGQKARLPLEAIVEIAPGKMWVVHGGWQWAVGSGRLAGTFLESASGFILIIHDHTLHSLALCPSSTDILYSNSTVNCCWISSIRDCVGTTAGMVYVASRRGQ